MVFGDCRPGHQATRGAATQERRAKRVRRSFLAKPGEIAAPQISSCRIPGARLRPTYGDDWPTALLRSRRDALIMQLFPTNGSASESWTRRGPLRIHQSDLPADRATLLHDVIHEQKYQFSPREYDLLHIQKLRPRYQWQQVHVQANLGVLVNSVVILPFPKHLAPPLPSSGSMVVWKRGAHIISQRSPKLLRRRPPFDHLQSSWLEIY